MYCRVVNNKILPPTELPENTDQVSGFRYLDDASLASWGYYPFVEGAIPAHDPLTKKLVPTYTLANGQVTVSYVLADREDASAALTQAKDLALRTVDAQAELARSKFLTQGMGQAMEYQATLDEAKSYSSTGDYPFLTAEKDALATTGTTMTLAQVANKILTEAAAWIAAGSEIKRLRRTAKLTIDAATSQAEIDAVFPISWPN